VSTMNAGLVTVATDQLVVDSTGSVVDTGIFTFSGSIFGLGILFRL